MQHPSRRHLEAVIRDKSGHPLVRCLITRGRYVIGQDWKNEIIVDEPTISLKHARLTVESDTEFLIEDLESANGVRVNGREIHEGTPVDLQSRVEIGETTLEFQRGGLPAAVFEWLPDGFLRQNRYNVGEVVVQGSTSTIFEAYDTSLGRSLAIKVMRPESQSVAASVLRFVREAQISSQLQHPGVLPVYELNLDPQSQLFYTTRFVEGESLASLLEAVAATAPGQKPAHSLGSLLSIFGRICDAVAFAHSRGVIHCCLRPECVSIGSFGEVFVNQWAMAKVDHRDASGAPLSAPLRVAPCDTLPPVSAFSAPEQAAELLEEIDPRTDIYALGGILYKILTLRDPLVPTAQTSLLELALTGAVPPIASVSKEPLPHCPGGRIPEALAAAATRAQSVKAEQRFQSVQDLQHAITATDAATGEPTLWKQFSGFLGKKQD